MGRLTIVNICVAFITIAVPIAIRYTGVRKQFGPSNGEELPVLEYQLVVSAILIFDSKDIKSKQFFTFINLCIMILLFKNVFNT